MDQSADFFVIVDRAGQRLLLVGVSPPRVDVLSLADLNNAIAALNEGPDANPLDLLQLAFQLSLTTSESQPPIEAAQQVLVDGEATTANIAIAAVDPLLITIARMTRGH